MDAGQAADVAVAAMGSRDIFFLTAMVLGGLVLFIQGMNMMSDALRKAAGSSMRTLLSSATRNRFGGLFLGLVLGTLIQSSATSVMIVGFINAGLMTLVESVGVMLGMNIGTTISMQLVSFKLGAYCFFLITTGFVLQFVIPNDKVRHVGQSLLGFGIIFLGLNIMSDAIKPHREMFTDFIQGIQGDTMPGLLKGVLISTLVTGIIQSSGAVIAMCFALISAGAVTDLNQVYPVVLGANIGTCATGLLGSIGTNIEARRSAVSHLMFNVLGSLVAIVFAPWFIRFGEWTPGDLIHQTANVNTAVMVVRALMVLPIPSAYARFITWLMPSRKPPPPPTFLDRKLVQFPEKAIYAAICELRRVMKVCAESFSITIDVLFRPERKKVQAIKLNENVVDEIKRSMKDYLGVLTRKYLSRRQAIIIQHLNRCMADIERIGDHIDELCDISVRRWSRAEARFNRDTLEILCSLHEGVARVLRLVVQSLDPDNQDFQALAQAILRARDEYVERSINSKASFTEKLAAHEFSPIVGMFFSEYVGAYDRIVKHAKTIALAEKTPYFWIKRQKLERMVDDEPDYKPPPLSDPHDFLDRLHSENYL
ncbi:MAG TPA: Na/Pi cotransporter family protein [Kiritimatiellia bacterium]|nr:Na/Pi cotransporter family protein [Kiritimatiellia bacterium]HRZ11949.1 Na/Pi cotransporter family protein [Kiritimatiellia bacterium]HSA17245.1 Na/Pi cotransporter family protein [Kiritimatiellia bacterium]